jgi:DNA-binding Xre family transcriptional regulator
MFKFIQALIFFIFFGLNFAWAQDSKNIYFIDSISSKAIAKNPSDARKASIANARRDAFMVLLTRLKMPIATSDNISDAEIADMVRSEQVVDEKIAGNSYSATFNIIFAKDFVDHILAKKSDNQQIKAIDKAEKYSEKFVIIPVKMAKFRPLVWEPENDWRVMLDRIISKNNLQKSYAIPEANAENISLVNGQNMKNVTFANLEKIINNNGSEASYVLFFNFDEIENKVLVEVVYLRKLLKKQFRLSFINVDRLSYNDLILKVAEKTLEYLGNNSIGSDEILNKNAINIHLKIQELQEWLNIKKIIEDAKLVDNVVVNSISRDEVMASINYLNPNVPIEQAFEKVGISISKQSQGFYEINNITQ